MKEFDFIKTEEELERENPGQEPSYMTESEQSQRHRYKKGLWIYFLTLLILPGFLYFILTSVATIDEDDTIWVNATVNFFTYAIMIGFFIKIFYNDFKRDFKKLRVLSFAAFALIIIGYLYLFAGNVLAFSIQQIAEQFGIIVPDSENQAIFEAMILSDSVFIVFITAVAAIILGPVTEELIFRKGLFGLIRNEKKALILSAMIFALIHMITEIIYFIIDSVAYISNSDWLSVGQSFATFLVILAPYFISGVAFGLIYIKSNRNIYIPIAVHIISNLIAVAIVFFSGF